jgi:hypothetical protein
MIHDVEPEKQFSRTTLFVGRALTIAAAAVGFLGGALTAASPVIALLSGVLGLCAWLLAAIYVVDMLAYPRKPLSGEHGKLTYEMHHEIWRDFLICLLTGLSLMLIYHQGHHVYDTTGIDIGALALPFLISALVFCFSALRDARVIHPVKGWVLMAFGLAILLGGMVISYGLTRIVEGHYSIARSTWMQCTMLMASVYLFMLMRKIAFALSKRCSFFSPFAVRLSQLFIRQAQYDALSSRLAQVPWRIAKVPNAKRSKGDRHDRTRH